jgi:hypothetical protein
MSSVILAVFPDYQTAASVRVTLVRDGFPTDRVALTAQHELGRAGLAPADSPYAKCVQYFRTLLANEDERHYPEALSRRIEDGAAAVVVHPRGALEIARATEILKQANPADLIGHDLTKHGWERAAARNESSWIKHVWLERSPDTDCIYCQLFPARQARQA